MKLSKILLFSFIVSGSAFSEENALGHEKHSEKAEITKSVKKNYPFGLTYKNDYGEEASYPLAFSFTEYRQEWSCLFLGKYISKDPSTCSEWKKRVVNSRGEVESKEDFVEFKLAKQSEVKKIDTKSLKLYRKQRKIIQELVKRPDIRAALQKKKIEAFKIVIANNLVDKNVRDEKLIYGNQIIRSKINTSEAGAYSNVYQITALINSKGKEFIVHNGMIEVFLKMED